jgi:hypothetical protein
MNTLGAMGSFASSILFPIFMGWSGNIKPYFGLAALLHIIALGCWKYIEPSKGLLQRETLPALSAPNNQSALAASG